MAEQSKVAVDWSITNLDTGEKIQPQFPMPEDGVTITVGAVIADQRLYGSQYGVKHWTGGAPVTFTFSCVLFARHATEASAVKNLLGRLAMLTERDDKLKRPPICQFTYGSFLSDEVLVERIDPNILSVDSAGYPREVRLAITLQRYKPFSQRQVDPTKPAKESYFLVTGAAERTYEQVAKIYYGDPMLGDRLRKRHPEHPFCPPLGAVVKVPPRDILLREEVEPAFHAFDLADEDAARNYDRILADRNTRQIVEVK